MGLDMYLKAKRYVSGFDFMRSKPDYQEEVKIFDAVKDAIGIDLAEDSPSLTVCATVAYWRKANQIHRWFVQNVQSGEDDCREYYVSREKLQELHDLCQKVLDSTTLVDGAVRNGSIYTPEEGRKEIVEAGQVLKNEAVAEALLPTQGGFFFGGTDYDQWYFEDVTHTRDVLAKILNDERFKGHKWDFYYESSW